MAYQGPLLNLVQYLPNLTELTIPPFPDLSAILKGISDLPTGSSLSCLDIFETIGDSDYVDPVTIIDLTGLREGSKGLENLTTLSIYSSYSAALQIFLGPRNLKEIYIASFEPEPAGEVRELTSQIAQTCVQIEKITLTFLDTGTEFFNRLKASPTADVIVTFDDLRPLLSCIGITYFRIDTARPLGLTDVDMERLAERWPSLKTLSLAPLPGILSETPKQLSLHSLLHLANHCPQLNEVYLYLDTKHVPEDMKTFSTFTQLARLDVGFSPIKNSVQVTRFLSQILPPEVSLTWGCDDEAPEWEDTDLISLNINSKWRRRWKRVSKYLCHKYEKTRKESCRKGVDVEEEYTRTERHAR